MLKAAGATSADNSFVNYAVVKDDTANDSNATTPDITDRSDDGTTETTYENKGTGAYLGKDDNSKATVTTTNQTRAIAISPGVNKEVALLTSGAILVILIAIPLLTRVPTLQKQQLQVQYYFL